jgi:polysaccharide pyruvyl transferase WcaK-like protein/sulfatase maturation enzyme AslB (radical SAM superfamily)
LSEIRALAVGLLQSIDWPQRPRVLNYQVNDICNARCVMCNIWKRKRDRELSPKEFAALLSKPFFQRLEHVGITGGEPTIRKDLADYYAAALDTLPNLRGGSFITNGFSPSRALDVYVAAANRYRQAGVGFGGMVSIDGVGNVHDRVRGRVGAFRRSTETFFGLRDAGVDAIACCTVVKTNVFGLHDLLEWSRKHDTYVRFRVGEFIERLYNGDATQEIRAFDDAELKHLVSFLHLLIAEYEPSADVKRTYESILSILTGSERLIGCPYQTTWAVNVDCRGRFAHCAPKGEPHAFSAMPSLDYWNHRAEREHIKAVHCQTCIHDYHAPWTQQEAAARIEVQALDLYAKVPGTAVEARQSGAFPLEEMKHLALIGWYGTETAGDIAILGGIVGDYLEANPDLRFTLFSLFPFYTRLTVKDLGERLASRIDVIGYDSVAASRAIEHCDAVVMAGGPLMDIAETSRIATLFAAFAKRGKPAVVERCGIGPLNVEQYREYVLAIARMATTLRVRDSASARYLARLGIEKPVEVGRDPAVGYIQRSGIVFRETDSRTIACFLRELTPEYPQDVSADRAERIVRGYLEDLLEAFPEFELRLYPMHYFPVGFDDRRFAQRLLRQIVHPRLKVVDKPMSPRELLEVMAQSALSVCMRFHSVVFAHEVGAPFVAIDYTAGGKIRGFLEDVGRLDRYTDFGTLRARGIEIAKHQLGVVLHG